MKLTEKQKDRLIACIGLIIALVQTVIAILTYLK